MNEKEIAGIMLSMRQGYSPVCAPSYGDHTHCFLPSDPRTSDPRKEARKTNPETVMFGVSSTFVRWFILLMISCMMVHKWCTNIFVGLGCNNSTALFNGMCGWVSAGQHFAKNVAWTFASGASTIVLAKIKNAHNES